jgi:uncharacterized protein (DUF3084 family)
MNRLVKIVAPIIVILASIGSLVITNQVKTQKEGLKGEIAQLNTDLTNTRGDLSKTRTALAETGQKLQQSEEKRAVAEGDRQRAQVELGERTRELEAEKGKVAELRQQVEDTKGKVATLEKTLAELQGAADGEKVDPAELKKAVEKVAVLEKENKVIGDQLVALSAERDRLVKEVEDLKVTPVGVRGSVAEVNNRWGFVVFDVGQVHKVRPNTQFLVFRDNTLVGKANVIAVNPTTAIAEMLPGFQRLDPRVGDIVIH